MNLFKRAWQLNDRQRKAVILGASSFGLILIGGLVMIGYQWAKLDLDATAPGFDLVFFSRIVLARAGASIGTWAFALAFALSGLLALESSRLGKSMFRWLRDDRGSVCEPTSVLAAKTLNYGLALLGFLVAAGLIASRILP